MARFLATCAAVALMATAAHAEFFAAADGCDVRRVRWGMSPAQVRAGEEGEPTAVEGELLIYPMQVGGRPCHVSYLFDRDQLCMVFYQFSDIFDELPPYFDEVVRMREELAQRHGEPEIDRWDWEDQLFAEDPSLRAEALGLGLVRYELGWMTDDSLVALRMSGGNLKADILVMYADASGFPAGQTAFGDLFAATLGLPSPYYR